jgi:hypothetical protein
MCETKLLLMHAQRAQIMEDVHPYLLQTAPGPLSTDMDLLGRPQRDRLVAVPHLQWS